MTAYRVLLVDDEAANRDMLSRRLEKRGYSVGVAASGAEALEALDKEPWSAILLDVQMPGMSGLEVLQKVRERWSAAELPVLMVTAKDSSDDIVSALDLGANDYVTKPVDFPVAVARLRTQLARKAAEDRLRASEERYALAARGANDGLWDWDLTTNDLHVSERWKLIVGCEPHASLTRPEGWFDRVHAEDLARLRHDLEAHLGGRTPHFENEHRLRHASGGFRWVLARGMAVHDRHGAPMRMAGSLSDVTTSKVVDSLTGLPNRMLLHERLEHVLGSHAAGESGTCAVVLLDIDGFQLVVEGHGQSVADTLLRAIARRLQSSLRSSDAVAPSTDRSTGQTLARLGSDEFVFVLHQVRDAVDALRVAERLQRVLARPFTLQDREMFISASVGIALSGTGATPDDLLRDADTAMTRARARGPGRVEVFETGMREQVLERLQLDAALRLGLERHEFLPYYQPIVELASGRLVGFEALIRWRRADGRLVSPAEFVPTLEASGLIVPVGRQFTADVCRQLRAWRDESPASHGLWVNINFASSQFAEAGLLETLLATIGEAGLCPEDIVVEITESAAIGNIDRAAETLSAFQAAGLRVVLDDFGTGYSSLSCLHELPIAGIKLDRTFIASQRRHPAILAAVVSLAAHLGLTVTAEGIETSVQHAELSALGCDYAQGYHFARPLDAEAAEMLIRRQVTWRPDAAASCAPATAA